MEQPFTKEGKSQGELADQYLRRTIFTAEKAFPFLKYRMRVVQKEIVRMSTCLCVPLSR